MAILNMGRTASYRYKAYQHETDTLYVYCDECGSFRLRRRLRARQWLLVVGHVLVAAAALANYSRAISENLVLVFVLALVYLPYLERMWGDASYRCRGCGNTRVTLNHPLDYPCELQRYNTLNLSCADVDVAERRAKRRSVEYWVDARSEESPAVRAGSQRTVPELQRR